MAIMLSPGCPCCGSFSILAGIYCTRWQCTPGGIINEIYFPPQTITLNLLGTGSVYPGFNSINQVLGQCSIDEELSFQYIGTNPIPTVTSRVIEFLKNGSLDVTGLSNKYPSTYDDFISKGWPPCLINSGQTAQNNSWYKLDFDLGQFGNVYRIFFISRASNGFVGSHYYILNLQEFPLAKHPGLPQTDPPIPQNLKGICCSPCIIDTTKPLKLHINYDIDTSSYEYDVCTAYCQDTASYTYLLYFGFSSHEECIEHWEDIPAYNVKVDITNTVTDIEVELNWMGDHWESNEIRLYDETTTHKIYSPWCPSTDSPCQRVETHKNYVKFSIGCGGSPVINPIEILSSCTNDGKVLSFPITSTVTQKDIEITYDPGHISSGWNSLISSLTTCNGISCIVYCCHKTTDCCGKFYGSIISKFKDLSCEPFSGNLLPYIPDNVSNNTCTATVTGNISQTEV